MKILAFCFLTLLSFHAVAQTKCSDFRSGKFENRTESGAFSLVERMDSIQIEKIGLIEVTLKVTWIDECTYRLSFKTGNEAWWKTAQSRQRQEDMIVRIVELLNNGYVQEAVVVNDRRRRSRTTMVRIN